MYTIVMRKRIIFTFYWKDLKGIIKFASYFLLEPLQIHALKNYTLNWSALFCFRSCFSIYNIRHSVRVYSLFSSIVLANYNICAMIIYDQLLAGMPGLGERGEGVRGAGGVVTETVTYRCCDNHWCKKNPLKSILVRKPAPDKSDIDLTIMIIKHNKMPIIG